LIEIPRLFVDRKFEASKRAHVTDPLVQEFWSKQIASTSDFHKSEMLNYFSSKFGHFINNTLMRNIIGQSKSSFNFSEAIAQEKIVLINLSKGKIGELNAQMLGLIAVAKLNAAILQRATIETNLRYPFFLYVDEFHNLLTDTFITMLSESRKYGLGLHITNQYFSQLPKKIQDAILGNVGTLICFSVGIEDAERLAREFEPFTKDDFLNLERFNFFIKLMIDGKTSNPFSGVSLKSLAIPDLEIAADIRKLNQLAFGKPLLLVEEHINQAIL
jgi:type IV secretory pathway TraG/TraD family ATPase VirD4